MLPDYIGKGYGYELLNWATKELIKQGYIQILLWVLDDNHLANEFYEKNGFIEIDNYLDDNIGGKHLREVMFVFNQSI